MCGIIASCVGPVAQIGQQAFSKSFSRDDLAQQLDEALDTIKHRGPDGSNIWISEDGYVGLGHCRLSINDLSPAGLQPLHNDNVHAVVNGELYDYERLRGECEKAGYEFSSTSDSELVMALYKIHGAPGLFQHLRGEFVFVLYDEEKNSVIVARDRYGIKPLYWTLFKDRVLFAAEIKAFIPLGWKPQWNAAAIATCSWMSGCQTLFKGVNKVMPGTWVEMTNQSELKTHTYWDLEYPDKNIEETRSIDEIITTAREHLVEAVRHRMKADVPIGVYLSGGIDSSAIAGIVAHLARENNVKIGSEVSANVECFNIQFPKDSGYDESEIADRTAEFLGLKVHKKYVDEAQLAQDFEDAVYHAEHPFNDLNYVAKYALSTLPPEHGIKVVLTGEGSDEHFLGYSFYVPEIFRAPDLGMPDSILAKDTMLRETLLGSAIYENIQVFKAQGSDLFSNISDEALEKYKNNTMPSNMVARQPSNAIFAPWVVEMYNQGLDRRDWILPELPIEPRDKMQNKWHPAHSALYIMAKTGFANIVLAGLGDRAEMAHSVEGRTPFLDHHLTDYINNVPPTLKAKYRVGNDGELDQMEGFWWKAAGGAMRALTEKWLLREMVKPFVTDEIYRRRKQPFLAPSKWLKNGPLQTMFKRLITKEAVEELGFVNWATVEPALEDAFGDGANTTSLRMLQFVGGWIVLGQRLGVKPDKQSEYEDY